MTSLKEKIIEGIRAEGPINFQVFMETALYHPELGYYMRPSTKIGRAGDFYTSPHLHSIFGAMLGRQMEEMWHVLGKPRTFHIVEMGAGMGYLAKDILDYLQHREISAHINYVIIELNETIKKQQQHLMNGHLDKVVWHSTLKELRPVKGCFISNELIDAFPVRIVESFDTLYEVYVTTTKDTLSEMRTPCSAEVENYFKEFSIDLPKDMPDGYRTEVNLKAKEWLRGVAGKLADGFVLTIDYGYPSWEYYSRERTKGTLLCYHNHQITADPYRYIGEQDITAHVNFSALKKWGEDFGLKTVGFCAQGTYLISLGIHEVMSDFYGDSLDSFETVKIKNLILPQGMGESHKVLVQFKGDRKVTLRGFMLRSKVDHL